MKQEKKVELVNGMVLAIRSRIVPPHRDRTIRAARQAMAALSGSAPQGRWLLPCSEVGVNRKRKSN